MRQDSQGRVACETCITTGLVVVMGEISTNAYIDIHIGAAVTVAVVVIICLLPEGVLAAIISAFTSAISSYGGLIIAAA